MFNQTDKLKNIFLFDEVFTKFLSKSII